MRQPVLSILCSALFLLLAAACNGGQPVPAQRGHSAERGTERTTKKGDTLRGRAVKVQDGDTFDLLDGERHSTRVRLFGIDAPEKAQPFGNKSKAALGALLEDAPLLAVVRDKDQYRRAVCDVYSAGGKWVNLQQVEAGMAWHYIQYSADAGLAAAERSARAAGSGLWADSHPTPPWAFRRDKRQQRHALSAP